MSQLSEIVSPAGQLPAALRDGVEGLDLDVEVSFYSYTRVVLPADGYLFWQPLVPKIFKGSLHYSQELQQNEDETVGFATVVFTSECKIQEFECSPIDTLWVGCIPSASGLPSSNPQRFSFSQQQGLYTQAGLWHYFGHSVYPAMASQLLDGPNAIDPNQAVVSNSLPLWLSLSKYPAPFGDWFANSLTLYPSFAVQQNTIPPYGAVHIEETTALQAVPFIDMNRNHYQLVADRVRVTLYGLQNNAAMDFIDCVMQYSVSTDNFGIMNMPVVRDGKRTQPEIQALAMQKVIDFEVSYYQSRVATVARTMILDALPVDYIFIGP